MAEMNNGLQQFFSSLGAIMRPGSTDASSETPPDAPTTPVAPFSAQEGTQMPQNAAPAPTQAESAPPEPAAAPVAAVVAPTGGPPAGATSAQLTEAQVAGMNPLDVNRNWSAVQAFMDTGA